MTSSDDRSSTAASNASAGMGGPEAASNGPEAGATQTPRLVVSWLIVGLPLAYGLYQTISKTLPLFGG